MAKKTNYYASMKEALETFDLKNLKSWMKKNNHALFTSFKNAPESVQMATMCKMICNRTDMLGSKVHKKAVKWLTEHNMSGRIF